MNMKRTKLFIISLISCLILAGCGGTDDDLVGYDLSGLDESAYEAAMQEMAQNEEDLKEEPSEDVDEPSEEEDKSSEDEEKPAEEKLPEEEKADLKTVLLKEADATEDELVFFHKEDFDGDGEEEAFAIIGEVLDDFEDWDIAEGSVWFVGSEGCEKLHDSDGMGVSTSDRVMTLGDMKYVLFDDVYATGIQTFAWVVEDGEAVEAAFSGAGEVLPDEEEEGQFEIMDSSYDSMYDTEAEGTMGHTWKHYYFYYDNEDGGVYEYGGTEIDQKKAAELCGIDIIGKFLPKGYQLDSIFLRGNGLVVVNYEYTEDEYIYYYHYIYDFINGCFIDDTGEETGNEPLEGVYREALCPDIASYPEAPGE